MSILPIRIQIIYRLRKAESKRAKKICKEIEEEENKMTQIQEKRHQVMEKVCTTTDSYTILQSSPRSVFFFSSCDKDYHKEEVRFLL